MAQRSEPDDLTLVRLLWSQDAGRGVRPGPKPGLTVRDIVRVGVEIADDRSGPELSLRVVAQRLDRTPMALYPYVGSKRALLQLMYDQVHSELPAATSVLDWTLALAELYARHHWLSEVSWSRPVLGPHEQAALESLLTVLPATVQRAVVVSLLFTQARATGRLIADARFAPIASGVDDVQWWRQRSAAMQAVVPDFVDRFPLGAVVGGVPDHPLPSWVLPGAGHLERTAWAGLQESVAVVLAGAD